MLLTRRLRAGILLYALFMAAVFALFLQFYVNRVRASHQVRQALYHQTQASLMAELTKAQAEKASGSYQFDQGTTSYHRKDDQLTVTVNLRSGQSYRYDFLVQPKPEDKKKETDKESKKERQPEKDEVVFSEKTELPPTDSGRQAEQRELQATSSAQPEPAATELSELGSSDHSSATNNQS